MNIPVCILKSYFLWGILACCKEAQLKAVVPSSFFVDAILYLLDERKRYYMITQIFSKYLNLCLVL